MNSIFKYLLIDIYGGTLNLGDCKMRVNTDLYLNENWK